MRRKIKEYNSVDNEYHISEKTYETSLNGREIVKNKKDKPGIVFNEYEELLNERGNVKKRKKKQKPGIVHNECEESLNEGDNVKNKKNKQEIICNEYEESSNERGNAKKRKKKQKLGIVYNECEESLNEEENVKNKKKRVVLFNEYEQSLNETIKVKKKKQKPGIVYKKYEESFNGRGKIKKNQQNQGTLCDKYEESLNERGNVKKNKQKQGIVYNEYEESLNEGESEKKKKSGILFNENEELLNENESVMKEEKIEPSRKLWDKYEGSLNEREKEKKKKPGIVYLSNIPKYMSVGYIRDAFSNFGEVGRIYLQEDVRDIRKSKKKSKKLYARNFAEGWVEFKSKRIAKEVAVALNNTQIGGRKKSKFYDCIWTIKYLPRFKWTHLSERLSYEKAVHKQRMRTEIYQAKREADYFSHNIDKSEMLKRKMSKGQKLENYVNAPVEIRQRETEDQILAKKNLKKEKFQSQRGDKLNENEDRDDFLKSLFA